MKIAILTSNILDGVIVAEGILKAGKDVSAIVYEQAGKSSLTAKIKTKARALYLIICKKLEHGSFNGIAGKYRHVQIKAVDRINNHYTVNFLKSLKPDLMIVVGTRKLKKEVFSIAPLGAINLHTGILPFYRGADSEFWALHNNEPDRIGVTVHFINEGLDCGNIILQERQSVKPGDTIGKMRIKNIYLGMKTIIKVIDQLESGKADNYKQNNDLAVTYKSANVSDKRLLKNKLAQWGKRGSVLKVFGNGASKVSEEVAKTPLITYMDSAETDYPNIFCLRIDADEYHSDTILSYNALFKKFHNAITIFVNAGNFKDKSGTIKGWAGDGIDIQSHGFYHHTYRDYKTNLHNIRKARLFFEGIGIFTKGFVSPAGRWNRGLSIALENEGYEYSSEFSYDYMGFPTYPMLKDRISKVLQIPVFPVAPELFLERGMNNVDEIVSYYKGAIDEMDACGLPVILYAHTSRYAEVPVILKSVIEYAIFDKNLTPTNMTHFYQWWKERPCGVPYPKQVRRSIKAPGSHYLGKTANSGYYKEAKRLLKKIIDYEKITPAEELYCSKFKKAAKLCVRKFL